MSMYIGFGGDSLNKAVGATIPTLGALRGVCRPLYGTWDVFGYYGRQGSSSTAVGQAAINHIATTSDFAKIGYIKIYGSAILAGTYIKIYAVRA